ncbi:MAG: lysophospholipid acyltransferase family protein [Acidimicrobiia bacterium]
MLPRHSAGFPLGAHTCWRRADPVARKLFGWYLDFQSSGEAPPGPIVVAANHYSHLDPFVVGMAVRRPVRYLAVDELFGRSRLFDAVTYWMGAIPMSRVRAPVRALRTALTHLESGGAVGVFPESHRVWTWGETPPKRGAAWLSLRNGAPLVPVALEGTRESFGRGAARIRRAPVRSVVAPAIDPDDYRGHDDPVGALTEEWARSIDEGLRVIHEQWC